MVNAYGKLLLEELECMHDYRRTSNSTFVAQRASANYWVPGREHR